MARYRTPQKKAFPWKGLLGAGGLGVVLVALGALLLWGLPAPEPAETDEPPESEEAAPPRPADGGDGDGGPGRRPPDEGPRRPSAAETRIGGAILGVGLILMGVLLPVGTFVIDRTSGKAWSRRAGKKHPWKRKI